MTDQEMIELAAQAAGVDGKIIPGFIGIGIGTERDGWIFWNPLKYNGDALELAVKLGLQITVGRIGIQLSKLGFPDILEQPGTDPYDATRRAIVRAAAQIGEHHGN